MKQMELTTTKRKVKISTGDQMFYLISGLILTAIFLLILYPCIFVVSASFSSGTAVQSGKVILWPVDISFVGYDTVFHNVNIWKGFINSLFYTFAGTIINVTLTMLAAYPLSRKDLVGRDKLMLFFTFTMFFNGGIITNYILVSKLGLIDTRWSMLLPGAMSIYNMIIARTFLQNSIPNELLEAAELDGCTDIQYLFQVRFTFIESSFSCFGIILRCGSLEYLFQCHDLFKKPGVISFNSILKRDPDFWSN